MNDTLNKLIESAVSSLWEVYYITESRNDCNIVLDSIIKIRELQPDSNVDKAHDVRVMKHMNGSYDTYANFTTVQNALDHMRRMEFNALGHDSWYIINADGLRLQLNNQDVLVVISDDR